MKKCLIIDDDSTARIIVEQLCLQSQQLEVVEQFSSAIEAIKFLNTNDEIDVIFLDIHMPTFSGFDFIQTLKTPPKIVLITSDKNLALDAFEYSCVIDYLVKPINLARFAKTIQKINTSPTVQSETNTTSTDKEDANDLYVNIDRRLVKINIPDIYVIEAKGDYIKIKTDTKNHIVHSTLKKIEDKLPSDTFLKVHRSYIINVKRIIDIEDNSVLIKQDIVPVSRANRSELMKRLNLL